MAMLTFHGVVDMSGDLTANSKHHSIICLKYIPPLPVHLKQFCVYVYQQ